MKRMRKIRRNKHSYGKIIVIILVVIICILSVGYASYQTNITVSTTGKVKKYKVNFDPNGGYIDISSKYVGAKYGDLPTPTREGYTFKGWNGKNLANIILVNDGTTINNDTIIFDASFIEGNYCNSIQVQKKYNYNYIGDVATYYSNELGNKQIQLTKDNTFNHLFFKINGSKKDRGLYAANLLEDNKTYAISFKFNYINYTACKAEISSLQVEEGTEATEWEPYFITKDTKVVQKHEHTLTAVWEENE